MKDPAQILKAMSDLARNRTMEVISLQRQIERLNRETDRELLRLHRQLPRSQQTFRPVERARADIKRRRAQRDHEADLARSERALDAVQQLLQRKGA